MKGKREKTQPVNPKQMAGIGAVLVLIVVAAVLLLQPWGGETPPEATAAPTGTPVPTATAAPEATATPANTAAPTTAPTAEPTPTPAPTATPVATATTAPTPAPTAVPQPVVTPAPPEATPAFVSFPYAIPDTTLVVQKLNSYDGIYLEDGSDTPISGVAAIVLTNTGSAGVDYAEILLDGTSTDFRFTASGLAGGASMVVMEAGKAPAVQQDYVQITADAAMTDRFEMSEGVLLVEETADGKLQVTNQSEQDIPCVRVFYKFYMEAENVYVGGITYVVKIEDLKAGASAQVAPSHYAVGSSRVIMAKTYETSAE